MLHVSRQALGDAIVALICAGRWVKDDAGLMVATSFTPDQVEHAIMGMLTTLLRNPVIADDEMPVPRWPNSK